jgi:ABC-type lipoprotein export system ATPase subunit
VPEFSYTDLVEWARSKLPAWQQDALRRLIERGELTHPDIAELADMALGQHRDGQMGRKVPSLPDEANLVAKSIPSVVLRGIREIEHVNALGSGPIVFESSGLTVVYGENASGKSGVTRILKKNCHARDPGGAVLPNVFEADPGRPAAAKIDFSVDGSDETHDWSDGEPKNPRLHAVNVFDSSCAVVQVEKANRISYTPELLHLFRDLAEGIERVAGELESRKRALGATPPALQALILASETPAGHALESLSHETDVKHLEELCTLSKGEVERLAQLGRALAEDPAKRAIAEETRARLVRDLEAFLAEANRHLGDDASAVHEALVREDARARAAAATAQAAFSGNSDLGEIGSDAWKSFWESARHYSEEHAYLGESFPVVRDGALCVLCQQPLSDAAQTRLASFEGFISADTQQQAEQAANALRVARSVLTAISFPEAVRRSLREAGIAETSEGEATRQYLIRAKLRCRRLLRITEQDAPVADLPLPGLPNLGPVLDQIETEVQQLRLAAKDESRREMQLEFDALKAREILSPHLDAARGEVERLKQHRLYDKALADCKTQRVTRKRREAAQWVVTDRLRSSFQTNLQQLGLGSSPVEVKLGTGERGEHPVEVKLVARPAVKPQEVLSEGERTCVALAGLLAELEMTGNRSTLVLDDPVSSLDHQYRKRVAERLVHESGARQVVLFTHDVVFLYLLRKYAAEVGLDIRELTLERGYKRNHASAKSGPPWVAMPVKQRITALREEMVEARRVLKAGDRSQYERNASLVYKRLRMSWERAVEEVLLNQTVLRFGDSVQTRRLNKLIDISEGDIERVTKEMSRCSDFEHDESGAVHAAIPDPDIVEEDIKSLAVWVKELRSKRGRS